MAILLAFRSYLLFAYCVDALAQLLQLDWIRHHRNLLIEGATGTGKTFLACALGQAACDRNF